MTARSSISGHRRASPRGRAAQGWIAPLLRNNGLSLTLLAIFLASWIGQALAGWFTYGETLRTHGMAAISFAAYLASSHFLEATAENWESEFFQMAAFVLLTVALTQKGSSESRTPGVPHESDEDPRQHRRDPGAPWPVRRGGWVLKVYEHSLSLVLIALFLAAFAVHAVAGADLASIEAAQHGEPPISTLEYLTTAKFWFESFQNWQSEFFSIAVLILLSIYLRERGSPQSKPVAAPHGETDG